VARRRGEHRDKPTFGAAVTVEVHCSMGRDPTDRRWVEFLSAPRRTTLRLGLELTAQIQRDVEEARVVLARTSTVP
jgi:hypothetical protein